MLIFLAGLSLLLYPTVSDYWNSLHASRAVSEYAEQVNALDKDRYKDLWKQAVDYNRTLLDRVNSFTLTEEQQEQYDGLLNLSGTGIMGYIEIPNINVSLPIYHGTAESVLQIAVGHVDWTSLPVGGEGTHCVLSGHRGLPSAKLFTNLDKIVEGDTFSIRVLDEDLCTLVTCTPYGINTHRLLVRGHRVPNTPEAANVRLTSDAIQIEPMLAAPLMALPVLIIFFAVLLHTGRKHPSEGESDEEENLDTTDIL